MDDARLIVAKDVDVDLRNEYLSNADGILTIAGMSIFNAAIDRARCVVMRSKTIDAVPVVHGRWDEVGKVFVHSMYDLFTKCSQCSFGHVRNEYQEPFRYCPNCGAKMDGVMG